MNACFVVLEPVNHLYKVIEAAKRRGYDILVIHSMDLGASGAYRAGFEAIDEAVRIPGWDDESAVVSLIETRLAGRRLVGTYAGIESSLPVEAMLRMHAGLPGHDVARLRQLLNKRWVRERLLEAGLTALRCFDPREVIVSGQFPADLASGFLKPICGTGSIHVTRCRSLDDLARGLDDWDRQLRRFRAVHLHHLALGGDLFLEEAAVGELMSLEGWVADGVYVPVGITSRTVLRRDESVEMGAVFPYAHPLHERIVAKIADIHAALGLRHGPTHTELIVSPSGEVELVELNVRFVGSDVLLLMNQALGLRVEDALCALACGEVPTGQDYTPRGFACLQLMLAPEGTEQLESVEIDTSLVDDFTLMKPIGFRFESTGFQQDQIARFLISDTSYDGVIRKAAQVRAGARINGLLLTDSPNNVVLLR